MNQTILLVEDNANILHNIKLVLELNDYTVYPATNGEKALEILENLESVPDIIVSDIVMPKMNGYDLLKKVSHDSRWYLIPFIFITAKTSPEDIRFGKKLGVDDYITKPFEDEDLLAAIAGKITRNRIQQRLSKPIEKKMRSSIDSASKMVLLTEIKEFGCIFLMEWSDQGPELKASFPPAADLPTELENIGVQLFQTAASIYRSENYCEAQDVLLRMENIKIDSFIYFDTVEDPLVKGGKQQFMLATLAPNIDYLESLRIREILVALATEIKAGKKWCVKEVWEKIAEILSISQSNNLNMLHSNI